ncbi:hypothetical protein Pan216_15240 [Planctomycetes bacterium Pan216]|uniref:Uncharacterized protein n=1 Tax=Kolteria novifilia TaxID=2527975 RepID=A0A518B134_9BACT|nr:hypothetical protein Pan216_15240 [Planctomycetes bacterium Pan216]
MGSKLGRASAPVLILVAIIALVIVLAFVESAADKQSKTAYRHLTAHVASLSDDEQAPTIEEVVALVATSPSETIDEQGHYRQQFTWYGLRPHTLYVVYTVDRPHRLKAFSLNEPLP